MIRYFLLIALIVSLSLPAYAQFGGRKFGQGNFGRFQFGIQKFENTDESIDGETDYIPDGAVFDTDLQIVKDTDNNIVTDTS